MARSVEIESVAESGAAREIGDEGGGYNDVAEIPSGFFEPNWIWTQL